MQGALGETNGNCTTVQVQFGTPGHPFLCPRIANKTNAIPWEGRIMSTTEAEREHEHHLVKGRSYRPIQLPDDAECVAVAAKVPGDPVLITWVDIGGAEWNLNIASDGFAQISCSAWPSLNKVSEVLEQLLGEGARLDHVHLGVGAS